MRILYIHGFGSNFDSNSPKIQTLSEIGEVVGYTYDYTETPEFNISNFIEYASQHKVDLIIGTSLGGWYASEVGRLCGVPFVAINPCVHPQESLVRYIGEQNLDHYGNLYTLTKEICNLYYSITGDGFGMVLVDDGDDVISPDSINTIEHGYRVHKFQGGSHRFDHMKESLSLILEHFHMGECVYEM